MSQSSIDSQLHERRLSAILAADVVGYSKLMGADEDGTLQALKAHRKAIVDPAIATHRGRIVKTTGDGMLVEFAVPSMQCAARSMSSAAWPSATRRCRQTSVSSSALALTSATSSAMAPTSTVTA